MGHFDRPTRKRTIHQLPERLQRLNRELAPGQLKSYDYLFAVRNGLRIQCCVLRDEDNRFFATAQVGMKAFRVPGGSPSGAFQMLMIVLRVHLAAMPTWMRNRLFDSQRKHDVMRRQSHAA